MFSHDGKSTLRDKKTHFLCQNMKNDEDMLAKKKNLKDETGAQADFRSLQNFANLFVKNTHT